MNSSQKVDNGFYYLNSILDELIETYYLIPPNADKYEKNQIRDTLSRTVKSICSDLLADPSGKSKKTLWEKTKTKQKGPYGSCRLFSADDKRRLLESERLKNYLLKRCRNIEQFDRDTEEQRKYEQVAVEQNNAAIRAFLESEIEEGFCEPILVTQEEVQKKKMEIMIEALFLRYFEPIDEEQLRKDMLTKSLVAGTNDNDADSARALERLKNHACYYRPRKADPEN